MSSCKHTLLYGFAIFAMFFGSGNLVFPLEIGIQAGNHWPLGFLGLFLAGILLPFLGLFVIKLHRGSYYNFFNEGGQLARLILPLFILSLLGAFGVVPRCITVAHGGLSYIFPQLSLAIFSFIFCVVCFFLCLQDRYLIRMVGKWMTPLLLALLVVLIGWGIGLAPALKPNGVPALSAFTNGFSISYQTMDLFAAFFFSPFVFKQIQAGMPPHSSTQSVIKAAIKPSLIGMGLLSTIYLGFVGLGAYYRELTAGVSAELILPTIAVHLMGKQAGLVIGIIVLFSCLTTAVALNNIYARYMAQLFRMPFPLWLLMTTILSFLISLLDFKGIAAFLAPVLNVSYPSLIVLTIMSIVIPGRKSLKMAVFYGVLAAVIYGKFFL